MGLFRLLLAFSVVMAHGYEYFGAENWYFTAYTSPIKIWSGSAVFAFFILSGFYISMIINEKYQHLPSGIRRFYINRALRLYPVHLTILGLYALFFAVAGMPSILLGDFSSSVTRSLYALIANPLILGVELLPLFHHEDWSLVIGPTWSLSLEMYFYLLAPLVVTRPLKQLIGVTLAALALRAGFFFADAPLLPWRYFYFPTDLVFFLMGCCSYRLYQAIRHDSRAAKIWGGGGCLPL
jgi:peptidoglycan/LPS O-acetylase OafA/YrhL